MLVRRSVGPKECWCCQVYGEDFEVPLPELEAELAVHTNLVQELRHASVIINVLWLID